MSSLMELKSTVMRQVQNRPSFRRRAEAATSETSKAASPVSEERSDFFDRMRSILQKQENIRRCWRTEEQERDNRQPKRGAE
ncbi:BAI1-associated protein 3-like [Hyperolius riggenbachi]|uniref:BAI1-associated protein 3-like n=1 Tax=Hyperolius riggenbachi TaxID=752182 RepID=UPI0035A34889